MSAETLGLACCLMGIVFGFVFGYGCGRDAVRPSGGVQGRAEPLKPGGGTTPPKSGRPPLPLPGNKPVCRPGRPLRGG